MKTEILDFIMAALVCFQLAAIGLIGICVVFLLVAQLAFELWWSDIEPLDGNLGGWF